MDTKKIFSVDDSINNHLRHYHELLGTGNVLNLAEFIPTYKLMSPSLHRYLNESHLDISTLSYCLTRVPLELRDAQQIILLKNKNQLPGLNTSSHVWHKVKAKNRRRLSFYNSISRTLVFVITSDSDIDDIVNILVAIEIEVAKIRQSITKQKKHYDDRELMGLFEVSQTDLDTLKSLLGPSWKEDLANWTVKKTTTIQLIVDQTSYLQAFQDWSDQLRRLSLFMDLYDTPVYFVSSNTHSLANLITGYVWQIEAKLFSYIESNYPQIYDQWRLIKSNNDPTRVYDFVYYLSKIYLENNPMERNERNQREASLGIKRIISTGPFETVTQIIPLNCFHHFEFPDPQLSSLNLEPLKNSSAIIINVEYPLGQAAYFLLKTFLDNFKNVKGVYIIGKAAILNGNIGDIQIPKMVLDEPTASTFSFNNCFNQILPTTTNVHIHESLKALSLYGTFLENRHQMENYLSSGYNVIEMESGSYLTAIYQHLNPQASIEKGNFEILNSPFDIGIINYASDNPLVQTLADTPLITRGIEPTYAATTAVIKRIVELESAS